MSDMAHPESTTTPGPLDGVVADFVRTGAHLHGANVDPEAAAALLADLRAVRRFDHSLFLSEDEFDANPRYVGVNPIPGRNLLERFEDRLGFVEAAPAVIASLTALLGDGYEILNKKVVCGVPARSVPEWLRRRIHGNPVNNLGPFVKPEYRDVTYFYGIDFHQDLIDYKCREADFVTLYVYLHTVTEADAPLYLLEGSHRLGGSIFPHNLARVGPTTWLYDNGAYGTTTVEQRVLTGGAGFVGMWHACTLHGTQPDAADHERISLRYLFGKATDGRVGIDEVNAVLTGPLSLESTRRDLDARGAAAVRQNTVLKA